jgi:hypothetical protein
MSRISSLSFGTTVVGDDVVDLSINTSTMAVTATSYNCVEGAFLAIVGAHGCANVLLQAGGFQSTIVYNVGGDASHVDRTLGGDDVSTGDPRGLTTVAAGAGPPPWDATDPAFDLFTVAASGLNVGDTVILSISASAADIATCRAQAAMDPVVACNGLSGGPDLRGDAWLEFTVVPVPAAVWLFGSALGLLGWVRRRLSVAA